MRLVALAACGIVLLGAALRLTSLATMPFGMHGDEALNVIDERTISWTHHPVFFPAKGGREALFFYWQNLFIMGLGASTLSVRLASAFVGVATVALEIAAMRRFFGWRAGLLAGAVLATFFWPVAQSRVGLRTVVLPIAVLVLLVLLRRAVARKSVRLLILAGAAVGLSAYTYTAARTLPLIVAGYAAYAIATRPRAWRTWVLGSLGAAASCAVVLVPLALYVRDHPAAFVQRLNETSALDSSGSLDVRAIGENLVTYARSVGGFGDVQGFINIPGRPMFDPPMAVLAWAGLALLVALAVAPTGLRRWLPRAWDRDAAWLCLLSLIAMLLPGLLSQGAPYFPRITGILPVIAVAPALTLDLALYHAGRTRLVAPAVAIAALALLVQTGETARDYFGVWAHQPDRAYGNSSGATALGLHLATGAPTTPLYVSTYEPEIPEALAPSASQHATWFQARRWLPLPGADSGPATYYFVRNDPKLDPPLLEQLLSSHARPVFDAADPVIGVEVARGYAVAPGALEALLPAAPAADFAGRLRITGASIYPDPADPGLFQVVLGVRADRDDPGYLSVSVRAVDGAGAAWGQVDGLGDDASRWRKGQETLVDLPLRLTSGTPPGRLSLAASVYELTTLATIPAGGGRPSLTLGTVEVQRAVPEREDAPYPAHDRLDVALGRAVQIVGVHIEPASPRQASTVRLDVLWRCVSPEPGASLELDAVDASGATLGRFEPGDGLTAPAAAQCVPGDVVLDRRYLHVGPRWPAGDVSIRATLAGSSPDAGTSARLLETLIAPLDRETTAPPLAIAVNAAFDDGIRLLGIREVSADSQGGRLVSLAWQAVRPPAGSYTAFVHVLGPDGKLVAQHDGPPAKGGWPTPYWETGQVVEDDHPLPSANGAGLAGSPGLSLEIGLYDPTTGKRLAILDPGAATAVDGALRIPLPAR